MTTLVCGRFPEGIAHIRTDLNLVVDFVDGRAEVDDQELVDALLRVPAVFEISAEPAPEPKPKPARKTGTRKSTEQGA